MKLILFVYRHRSEGSRMCSMYRAIFVWLCVMTAAMPAKSAVISGTYTIAAEPFGQYFGSGLDAVGRFSATITFDNSADTRGSQYFSPFPPSRDSLTSIFYTYTAMFDALEISWHYQLQGIIGYQYVFGINRASTTPSFSYGYLQSGQGPIGTIGTTSLASASSSNRSISFTPTTIPEPLSLGLFATGLLGLAFIARRRCHMEADTYRPAGSAFR